MSSQPHSESNQVNGSLEEKPTAAAEATSPESTLAVSSSDEVSNDDTPEFKADRKFWLALTPILVLAAMVSLDGTSVTVALPVSAMTVMELN